MVFIIHLLISAILNKVSRSWNPVSAAYANQCSSWIGFVMKMSPMFWVWSEIGKHFRKRVAHRQTHFLNYHHTVLVGPYCNASSSVCADKFLNQVDI